MKCPFCESKILQDRGDIWVEDEWNEDEERFEIEGFVNTFTCPECKAQIALLHWPESLTLEVFLRAGGAPSPTS